MLFSFRSANRSARSAFDKLFGISTAMSFSISEKVDAEREKQKQTTTDLRERASETRKQISSRLKELNEALTKRFAEFAALSSRVSSLTFCLRD